MTLNEMNQYFMHYATCRPSWNPEWTVLKVHAGDGVMTQTFYRLTLTPSGSVDWGDGTITPNGVRSHTYSQPGDYIIIIKGATWFGTHNGDNPIITEAIQCGSIITTAQQMFYGCKLLNKVYKSFELPSGVTDCYQIFQQTYALKQLSLNFPKGALDLRNAFTSSGITDVQLVIPSGATNYNSMYNSCNNLRNNINDLLPTSFEKQGVNIGFMFYYAENVQGEAPANMFWGDAARFSTYDRCFRGCKKLTNYEQIPADWK